MNAAVEQRMNATAGCQDKHVGRCVDTVIWNTEMAQICKVISRNFHICTVHSAVIKVFHYQLMHKRIVFKGVLKFTLKLQ